jgi:hypothetical protein
MRRQLRNLFIALAVAATAAAISAHPAQSQEPRRPELPGYDFSPNGAWRVRARQVRAERARALSRGDLAALNAPVTAGLPAPSAMAVTGVLRVPYLLVSFANTDPSSLRPPAAYDSALTLPVAPRDRPFSARSFYEQLSNDLLSLQGQVIGWIRLANDDAYYGVGDAHVDGLLPEVLTHQTGLPNTLVHALAVSGTNLFAGTHGSGVFLSTSNGTSWTAASTGLTNTDVFALAVSPNGAGGTHLLAGTTDRGGVFLSTNNGTSWSESRLGFTGGSTHAFAVSGTNLFAGTYGGVFLSTNNGSSWTAASTGLTNPDVRALAVSGTNLFAGTGGGVFLSTNNGSSWTAASTGLTNTYVRALAVSGTHLFAETHCGGVWRRPL